MLCSDTMVNMGITTVRLTVKNPAQPEKIFAENFLVDSGATYTIVPADILQRLNIQPVREETFSLADGRLVKRKVGNALFEFQGIESTAPVLFGEKDDSLLLGVLTLEAIGLTLDPLKRKLYKAHLRM